MHAARLINDQRKRSGTGFVTHHGSSSRSEFRRTVNTWYMQKLDKRRAAAVIARRKARGVNLSVLFAILAGIGTVFVIISAFIEVPGLRETGIFAVVLGILFAICCHYENSEMINIDEPLTSEVDLEAPSSANDLPSLPTDDGNSSDRKYSMSHPLYLSTSPRFDVILEEGEGETLSLENVDLASNSSKGSHDYCDGKRHNAAAQQMQDETV